ncbi:Down syndrome critical region protein 3 homolog [Acyrthosiphon pisum]|uniref:Vacuolar protein sorting-associated protein 26C n=1 Tax=Acyrthosiphon pisum TaxID=7029 RepID=A0A8R2AC76_ACYPI|nr:Down syndrome critical region protein 3 homolog [Acyrthosiphon pisum]|eukprot:XP_001947258.1 PREDICTED: Down syndrome critical region protein 3 homolog [Acyrthosiphon pisum]
MAVNLDIQLKRSNKVYREGDTIAGVVVIDTPTDVKHEGVFMTIEGTVDLQISTQNVGAFDAFYNSVKPVQLMMCSLDIARAGRFPSGITEIPFEAPVTPLLNKVLYESYHGVFINVQYLLKAVIKRNFLNKDIHKTLEFVVENNPCLNMQSSKVDKFVINQNTLANVNDSSNIPKFHIVGSIDSVICSIMQPFTGEMKIEHSDIPIKSIDVQLVRVETCGCAEGFSKDATEIQNIQVAEGNVSTGISIPIYMIFPRLFSCSTTKTTNFKIEFEVNVSVIFVDDHLVTENFPITLFR